MVMQLSLSYGNVLAATTPLLMLVRSGGDANPSNQPLQPADASVQHTALGYDKAARHLTGDSSYVCHSN